MLATSGALCIEEGQFVWQGINRHWACAAQAVTAALGALTTIGAVVRGREALTPLGMHLAALPVDVRCVWHSALGRDRRRASSWLKDVLRGRRLEVDTPTVHSTWHAGRNPASIKFSIGRRG